MREKEFVGKREMKAQEKRERRSKREREELKEGGIGRGKEGRWLEREVA